MLALFCLHPHLHWPGASVAGLEVRPSCCMSLRLLTLGLGPWCSGNSRCQSGLSTCCCFKMGKMGLSTNCSDPAFVLFRSAQKVWWSSLPWNLAWIARTGFGGNLNQIWAIWLEKGEIIVVQLQWLTPFWARGISTETPCRLCLGRRGTGPSPPATASGQDPSGQAEWLVGSTKPDQCVRK